MGIRLKYAPTGVEFGWSWDWAWQKPWRNSLVSKLKINTKLMSKFFSWKDFGKNKNFWSKKILVQNIWYLNFFDQKLFYTVKSDWVIQNSTQNSLRFLFCNFSYWGFPSWTFSNSSFCCCWKLSKILKIEQYLTKLWRKYLQRHKIKNNKFA